MVLDTNKVPEVAVVESRDGTWTYAPLGRNTYVEPEVDVGMEQEVGLAAVMDLDIGPNAAEDGSLKWTRLCTLSQIRAGGTPEGRGAQLSEQRLMGGI